MRRRPILRTSAFSSWGLDQFHFRSNQLTMFGTREDDSIRLRSCRVVLRRTQLRWTLRLIGSKSKASLLGDVVSSSWARARSQDRVVPQDGLRILEL
ncbi:hypothetical protein M6B38_152350 [Iris pallida]|uniref:Uncharacterized protein n=1 Tax=Iris pallida TaxID=29817 RepID=A0AAX6F777_IRIPA|nr:hypothetical protein M6B38_152350 [Iris pallida]